MSSSPLDANLPITNVETMPQIIGQSLWGARTAAGLFGLLGALALLLASIGIYGVMAYVISQQQREIGIRMALGGGTAAVLGLFLKRGWRSWPRAPSSASPARWCWDAR